MRTACRLAWVAVLSAAACGHSGSSATPPTPLIVAPHDGQTLFPGNVDFAGSATDPVDGVIPSSGLAWQVRNPAGAVTAAGQGSPLALSVLGTGDYVVMLSATDKAGLVGSVSQPLHIGSTIALLSRPDNHAIVGVGVPIRFDCTGQTQAGGATLASMTITGTNADTGAQIFASPIAIPPATGPGPFTGTTSPTVGAGNITVTCDVTTNLPSQRATDTLHLIAANPPVVAITSPAAGSQFTPGTVIQFTGTATSGTPGQTLTIGWADSIDGPIGGSALSFTHSYTGLAKHQVTLTATDPVGLSATATVDLYVQTAPLFTSAAPGNPATGSVLALAFDPGGALLWLGAGAGYASANLSTLAFANNTASTGNNPVSGVAVPSGTLRLFANLGNGVDILNGGTATNFNQMADPNSHGIGWRASDNAVFVVHDKGLSQTTVANLTSGTPAAATDFALDGNRALAIAVSAAGVPWVGSDGGGLLKIGTLPAFSAFRANQGLASDRVQALVTDPAGTVWAGTDRGLSRVALDGTITSWNGVFPDSNIQAVALDTASGLVWLGTPSGGVRFDPTVNPPRVTTYATPDLPGNNVNAVRVSGADKWFGGGGGLTRYSGK